MTVALGLILRIVGGLGAIALVVWLSYNWGSNARKAEYEAAIAKIQIEHAEVVAGAMGAATDRALEAQRRNFENATIAEDIATRARNAEGADSICVDADIVERLRELQ